ncbi:hypothetical protein [Flavobacterium sp. CLA17]|uniref:hypothetical protein n=1 Tax=Flavobacterium sp. CLA17 TaxID=2724135 RepID=UPI0019675089|nr:hypothetical protein [Flavobacterium sp. CLA17]QSB26335.1 hypothetical protein HAV12_018435 [Flavobacterium sp. CLA17]
MIIVSKIILTEEGLSIKSSLILRTIVLAEDVYSIPLQHSQVIEEANLEAILFFVFF